MKQTQIVMDMALIMLGGLLLAVGINFFIIPNTLSEGGVIGLTVIAHYLFDWSTGVVNFVLNILLLIIGYKFFEKRSLYYTVISILWSSLMIGLLEPYSQILTEDTLLSAVFSGLFVGLGLGLIFRSGGTNGGTTVLARMFHYLFGLSIGNAMLAIDIVVVLGSVFVIGLNKGMYTLVAVYIGAKVIDFFMERLEERAGVFIMSNKSDEISDLILNQLLRGVTTLDGKGGYSGQEKKILYIVIGKYEVVKLKRLIKEVDPQAYVTVHEVQEAIRKGYKANMAAKQKV